jgi:hypothetical protein
VLACDAERLAEPTGPGAEEQRRVEPAAHAHPLETVRWLERPHEHRARHTLLLADEVETPVDAVRAVDVRTAGRAEHRCVAGGAAAKAVARWILLVVGLDLDDPAPRAVDEQYRADQVGRHLVDAAGEELSREHARRSG